MRQCFLSACRKLLNDDEQVLKKVKVELNIPKSKVDAAKASSWQYLSLSYSVPWPLHLILSPQVLAKYNEVFRFLLMAKRTQLMLHDAWAEQKKEKKIKFTVSWQLRSHMMFVVDNLHYYLMADVLESQFSLLFARLNQSTNFEELRHAHDIFLSSIISNTFVNNKSVNQCLTDLLSCCLQYCRLVQVNQDSNCEEVSMNFSRHSSLLFKLLTSIKSRQTGSQLSQLLLRIDFNRYFSTYGHDVNRVSEM